MTAELWIWIAVAAAILVVGLWPLLRRRPTEGDRAVTGAAGGEWTETLARSRISELEAALDAFDIPDGARAAGERALLLAGAALAGGGRRAAARAGELAEKGLAQVRPTG